MTEMRDPRDNTGLLEDCECVYAPGLGGHITTHCREGHTPNAPRRSRREVTVHGAIATHLFRQHLKSSGVTWEQVPQPPPVSEFFKGYSTGVFRVVATEAEWDGIQQAKKEAEAGQ